MKLHSIIGNSQKLDGGAMFGNVPRAMWERWIAPDAENRIPLACRALLADGLAGKRVLFETGIGAFFEPRMRERFGVKFYVVALLFIVFDVWYFTRGRPTAAIRGTPKAPHGSQAA